MLVKTQRGLITIPPEGLEMLDLARSLGGNPLLVGGTVRDAVMGRQSSDFDVEVHGPIDMERFGYLLAEESKGRWRALFAGISFQVIKVRTTDGTEYDFAPPRRESKIGAGHKGFVTRADPSLTFAEASGRRDFTVNTLAWNPVTGDLLDAWNGMRDLERGVLRHPTAAFSEDPLRALRAVRFAAQLGFTVAPETIALCASLTGTYHELAQERVWGEWQKIAAKGLHLDMALQALWETGWECHFPQLAALHNVAQPWEYHQEGDVWVHTGMSASVAAALADDHGLDGDDRAVITLAALCHDMGKPSTTKTEADGRITSYDHAKAGVPIAREFLQGIGAPESIIRRVLPLVQEHMTAYTSRTTPAAVRRLARRLHEAGGATVEEWALVVQADQLGRISATQPPVKLEKWTDMAKSLTVATAPANPLVTGKMLIAAGMTPGKEFKPILAEAMAAQDDGGFSTWEGATEWLANRLNLPDRDDPEFPQDLLTEAEKQEMLEAKQDLWMENHYRPL